MSKTGFQVGAWAPGDVSPVGLLLAWSATQATADWHLLLWGECTPDSVGTTTSRQVNSRSSWLCLCLSVQAVSMPLPLQRPE